MSLSLVPSQSLGGVEVEVEEGEMVGRGREGGRARLLFIDDVLKKKARCESHTWRGNRIKSVTVHQQEGQEMQSEDWTGGWRMKFGRCYSLGRAVCAGT